MTVQEIKEAKENFEEMEREYRSYSNGGELAIFVTLEDMCIAIESMEKQIPKKPLKVKGECYKKTKDGKEFHEINLICPNCKERVLVPPFPCKCGQKIDWEEGGTSD